MSKKVIKRTCRVCGHIWFGSIGGGIAGQISKAFWAALVTTITRGSYIDIAKAREDLSRCPNCQASASYKSEFATVEDKKKKSHSKPIATSTIENPVLNSTEKKGCLGFLSVVAVVTVIAIIVASISTCQDKKEEEKNTTENDNASFERANSLLQNSEYDQALNVLNSISGKYFNHEKYKEFLALKEKLQHRADSLLSEDSYTLGKKLFDEGKYDEALPFFKKIYSKHKEYREVKNMITFIDEYLKAAANTLILFNYVHAKDNLNVYGASGKEFQSILNTANDKLIVLQSVVLTFGKMAKHIEFCERLQKSEFKYLKPQEKNNLKTGWKKITIQAKNKLKKEQLRDFPILRKELAKLITEMNLKANLKVDAKAKGNGNTSLEFVGVAFANETNIDIHYKSLISSGMLEKAIKLFRFKRVTYKWYEYDNGSYYKYDTPADGVEVNEKTVGEIKK